MLLAKIHKNKAEDIRKKLFSLGLVRKDYRIFNRGDFVYLPLFQMPPMELQQRYEFTIEEGIAEDREYRKSPQLQIIERLDIDEELVKYLPQRWERLGDVALIKIPPELEDLRFDIAATYAEVLRMKTIIREKGRISGVCRVPDIEILYGSDTETTHFENGIYYRLDVAKLMFSSGNIDEKLRMSALDCSGETIIDMFAGIGYFTIPLAVHTNPKKIIACEINPVSFSYLQQNIEINHVNDIVHPILGNNMDLKGYQIADRIVMGYVHTTHLHLKKAFELIKPNGTIHYHDTYPLEILPDEALKNIAAAAEHRKYNVKNIREVKSYSPGVSHIVIDIIVEQ